MKAMLVIGFFLCIIGYVNATSLRPMTDVEKEDIDLLSDVCAIDGKTYKEGRVYKYESAYYNTMPVVHEGYCKETLQLSQIEMQKIEETIMLFLYKKGFLDYPQNTLDIKEESGKIQIKKHVDYDVTIALNSQGQYFLINYLNPYIQKNIQDGLKNVSVDNKNISVLNHVGDIMNGANYVIYFEHINY